MNYIQEHTDKDYPRNIEAEQVVLGSALLEPNLTMPVIVDKKLLPEHFYERRHQYIFEAMLKLYVDAKPCDIVILANALEDAGTMEMSGGRMYLNQLLDRTTTTASLKHFVDIIRHKNTLRELIHAGERIEELGFDEIHEVNEVFSEANQIISSVSLPQDTPPYERIGGEMSEHLEKLERISADGGGVVGVPSGFSELDKLTSGFRDSDLVIIAARPGVGKCLGKGTPVLMFDGSIKNVEDVLDGDVLMGPDSLPRNVFGTTSGIGNLYRITPKKGGSYVVNENHVLSFKMSPSNTGDERYVCNVGVLDYFTKTNMIDYLAIILDRWE